MHENIPTHQTTQEVIKGIQLILKYQPDATFCCQRYRIYFGNYNADDMSIEDYKELRSLGWFKDSYEDEYVEKDMWSIILE